MQEITKTAYHSSPLYTPLTNLKLHFAAFPLFCQEMCNFPTVNSSQLWLPGSLSACICTQRQHHQRRVAGGIPYYFTLECSRRLMVPSWHLLLLLNLRPFPRQCHTPGFLTDAATSSTPGWLTNAECSSWVHSHYAPLFSPEK